MFIFQVLIATSTLAWGVNFPAHLVIIKGTEYYDGKTRRYVDFPITGNFSWFKDILNLSFIFSNLGLYKLNFENSCHVYNNQVKKFLFLV